MTLRESTPLEPRDFAVTRADLVRYAGASGDLNPIHWSDRVAVSVGLPGVVAHGMYTFALASRAVAGWAGGTSRVVSVTARFTKPVVVPDDDTGAAISVDGQVRTVADGLATIELTVTQGEQKVLGMASAVVRC
ncbi:MAG: MaoC/PaaZ C-terminal domain-containing protein [Nocardioidaceae bacterium]